MKTHVLKLALISFAVGSASAAVAVPLNGSSVPKRTILLENDSCDRASVSPQQSFQYHYDLARYYHFTGQYSQSCDECAKAMEINPTDKQPYSLQADDYRHLGKHENEIADCEKALS